MKLFKDHCTHSVSFLQKKYEILHNLRKSIIFALEMKKILG